MTALLFALVALADYRAVRFLIADSLIDGWRERFERWAFIDDDRHYRPVFVRHGRYSHRLTLLRGKVGELGTCPWCLGFHGAWIILLFCRQTGIAHVTWPMFWLLIWAVAGAQGLLSALEGVLDHTQQEPIDEE